MKQHVGTKGYTNKDSGIKPEKYANDYESVSRRTHAAPPAAHVSTRQHTSAWAAQSSGAALPPGPGHASALVPDRVENRLVVKS